MKKLALISLSVVAALGMSAQTYYFDFGGSGSRGTVTVNPDANGNYWNNITPATEGATSIAAKTAFDSLIDADGTESALSLVLCNAWGVNGNSGGGGLFNPSADLLGDLAVESATVDYMFNTNNGDGGRSFVIRGLDKTKGYRFTIFGTRSASDVREGLYSLTGVNGWATVMRAAGAGIGHNSENQNTDNAPQSDIIYPDASGNITLYIHHEATTYIPISCMKMETVESSYSREGTVARTLLFDFGSNGTNTARGEQTSAPGWNNITNNDGNYCAAGTVFADLIDSTGADTGFTLTVNERFTTNGGTSGGGLLTPDAELLGDIAVASATADYFFTETGETNRTMTFSGLDPKKAYRFNIFGSRSSNECRVGLYHIAGINDSYGAQQVAGNAFGSAAAQNTANILESAPIFPNSDGTITLTVINNAKTYVALSVLKIEELNGIARPDISVYTSATLGGEAVAEGEVTTMTAADRANWSVWAKLNAGTATVTAIDENATPKTITFDVPATGVYRVDANLDDDAVTLFECTYFCVEGSAVGGWNTTGIALNYIGQGRFNYKGDINGYDKSSDSGRVNFIMNKSWSYTYKRVAGSDHKLVLSDGEDIPLNPGCYDITVDLNNMTWNIANGLDDLDPYRITMMGSSVANGQGAQQVNGYNEGYAHLYDGQLADRYANEQSEYPFYISNISIGGNSSVNLLNRIDDLDRDYGKYVIFGISLGNEGIHGASNQSAIYNQFLNNMQTLIAHARAAGKTPIVMNNYTRGDFNASDYAYVKDMNTEIAHWDVPSINMLGAIDNGAGRWADTYQNGDDIYHPNTAGHAEFFYAMVPSMFDALEQGKVLTMQRLDALGHTLPAYHVIEFAPEGTVHSFTLALTAEMLGDGLLATVKCADASTLKITFADGRYALVVGNEVAATVDAPLTEGLDDIMLTQNYAANAMALYVNGIKSADIEGRYQPTLVTIGNESDEVGGICRVGELMFYRSSLFTHNPLAGNDLFKSSLEVYTPINPNPGAILPNLALSTNKVIYEDREKSGIEGIDHPTRLSVVGMNRSIKISTDSREDVVVANLAGIVVARLSVDGTAMVRDLAPGIYLVNNRKAVVR